MLSSAKILYSYFNLYIAADFHFFFVWLSGSIMPIKIERKKENVVFSKCNIIVLKRMFAQYLVNPGLVCNKYAFQTSFPFLRESLSHLESFYSHTYSLLCI